MTISEVRELAVRYVQSARPCHENCVHKHCNFAGEVMLVRDLVLELERQDAIISRLSETVGEDSGVIE